MPAAMRNGFVLGGLGRENCGRVSCGRRRNDEAFTLIEIIVVFALIALLLAIGRPALQALQGRSRVSLARAELTVLAQALEQYRWYYGDYPQTGDYAQARPDRAEPLQRSHAQVKLFHALTGVFGPRTLDENDAIDGRIWVEATRFALETSESADFQTASDRPPKKQVELTCFLDPWGRRYLYYYKCASDPTRWAAPSYVLYSAGTDGLQVPPNRESGLFPPGDSDQMVNSDNIQGSLLAP